MNTALFAAVNRVEVVLLVVLVSIKFSVTFPSNSGSKQYVKVESIETVAFSDAADVVSPKAMIANKEKSRSCMGYVYGTQLISRT